MKAIWKIIMISYLKMSAIISAYPVNADTHYM